MDIIKLNLTECTNPDVKIVYMSRGNGDTRACVIEVSADIRTLLRSKQKIYLRYTSCRFDDHVRVLQCYKCLGFGHAAKDCTRTAHCAYCAGEHESKTCKSRSDDLTCYNCKSDNADHNHSALDGKNCPILSRRIADKVRNTDYG